MKTHQCSCQVAGPERKEGGEGRERPRRGERGEAEKRGERPRRGGRGRREEEGEGKKRRERTRREGGGEEKGVMGGAEEKRKNGRKEKLLSRNSSIPHPLLTCSLAIARSRSKVDR